MVWFCGHLATCNKVVLYGHLYVKRALVEWPPSIPMVPLVLYAIPNTHTHTRTHTQHVLALVFSSLFFLSFLRQPCLCRLCVKIVKLLADRVVKLLIKEGDKVRITGGKYDCQTVTVASTADQRIDN